MATAPTADSLRPYYDGLTAGMPVCVRDLGPARGRGLIASRDIQEGETLFVERPLCAMQDKENRSLSLACGHCLQFVAALDTQVELLARRQDRISVLSNPPPPSSGGLLPLASCPSFLANVVPCSHGCGEVYCGAECRGAAWAAGGHCLLCTGPITDPGHPLILFKQHAMQTNGIFLLAAQVIASIVCRKEHLKCSLDEAASPFMCFVRCPWWECARGDAAAAEQMKIEAQEAVQLLQAALGPKLGPDVAPLFTLESFAGVIGMFELNQVSVVVRNPLAAYANALAELPPDQQAAGMAALGPAALAVQAAFDAEDAMREDDGEKSDEGGGEGGGGGGPSGSGAGGAEGEGEEGGEDEEDEEEGDCCAPRVPDAPTAEDVAAAGGSLFTPLDGTAMYSLICMMNHACDPSIEVLYADDGRGPVVARVVATRDIRAGEEVCHAYVDEGADVEERRESLLDYGFFCTCERCTQEGGAEQK